MLEFLKSDTFRRIVAGIVGAALPAINAFIGQKLGIQIPTEATVSAIVLVAGYIGQSVLNDIHARHVASVTTVDDAIKVLSQPAPDTNAALPGGLPPPWVP